MERSLQALAWLILNVSLFTPASDADSLRCAASERRVLPDTGGRSARPPFASGERLEYSVSFGHVHVGSGEMSLGTDTLDGRHVWRAQFAVDGGFKLLSVHDTNTSWFDAGSLSARRFRQRLHEPRYHADRDTRIFPERRAYQEAGDTAKASVAEPLDDVSLVYFVRTLALEPGHCYELKRYFLPDANPVVIHVLRRERVTVPAGTFNTIVLRPEIRTSGIFSQNGRAELWLSDDSPRILVQLRSKLPFGSINIYLRRASGVAPGG